MDKVVFMYLGGDVRIVARNFWYITQRRSYRGWTKVSASRSLSI